MNSTPNFPIGSGKPWIVGIAGGTGCGKTTLARRVSQGFERDSTVLLHADDYYHDRSLLAVDVRESINFDHPDALDFPLLIAHLQALCAWNSISCPRYDFVSHARLPQAVSVAARPVILLEGHLIFCHDTLRELLDLRVFVEASDGVRLTRRLLRDVRDRGRTMEAVMKQYFTSVKPMHETFVEPTRQYADVGGLG